MQNQSFHKISVIIPVFNAGKFINQAVKSVILLEEVGQIVLIEDGSQDNSFIECKKLADKYDKVLLLQHKDGINKGPGESRNLGIKNATQKYISFLDADDYYLPNRFEISLPLLVQNQNVDAVHEIVGVRYMDNESKRKHISRMMAAKSNIKNPKIPIDFTGIEDEITPDSLFFHLLKSDYGWIHLNGLLIRSSSLRGFKLFKKNALGQDAEFIKRFSCEKTIVGTNSFKPVAIRVVHDENRIINQKLQDNYKELINWKYWLDYSMNKKVKNKVLKYIILRTTDSPYKLLKFLRLARYFIRNPKMMKIFILK